VAGRVFISYLRADTANQAGWLADRLAGHFGRQQVVRDVEEIQLGNDFARRRQPRGVGVVVLVVGGGLASRFLT
jgi:hypothetical protein